MSKIEKLIEELCPEGVEFRELGAVCENIISGKNKQRIKTGEFPVYGSTGIIGHTDEYAFDKECLLIARVGANAGFVYRGKGKYDVSDNTLIVRPKAIYNLSFGYYQLSFLGINKLAKGGGQPLITAGDIKKIQIPIPPLPIQQEIVTILDTFTALDAELQAELEARRKQYEHYRNELLNFEGKEVEWKTLGDIGGILRGTAITEKETISGEFPVVANAPNPIYYHNKCNRNGETIVIARSGAYCGLVSYWNYPIFLTDAFSIHPDSTLFKTKFVYYYLKKDQRDIHLMKKGSGVPHVRAKDFESYSIPIPPLAEQERIVGILDKFDALVSGELPAEITARRKQYEYYREKLLTFEPLTTNH